MNNDPILRTSNDISPVLNPDVSTDVVSQSKQPNKFMSILKGVGSAAVGMIPGVGGALSGLMLGGGPNFGSMHAMIQQQQRFSMQLLNVQQQVGTQSQEFTAVSNLLKSRHDSEMSAVNNFKS